MLPRRLFLQATTARALHLHCFLSAIVAALGIFDMPRGALLVLSLQLYRSPCLNSCGYLSTFSLAQLSYPLLSFHWNVQAGINKKLFLQFLPLQGR
jgi:hypothetical protein